MSKPILCLDFDGVIHSYTSGWKGVAAIPDPVVPGAIDAMLAYLDAGFQVAIFSSRSKSFRGRWAMKRWLAARIGDHWAGDGPSPSHAEVECMGDARSVVRRFRWPWFKPAALMTIDDRALTFNGNWQSPEYDAKAIRAFKPWNKR